MLYKMLKTWSNDNTLQHILWFMFGYKHKTTLKIVEKVKQFFPTIQKHKIVIKMCYVGYNDGC